MAHLKDRFCLVPFHDLADGPDVGHHAIGSPYFSSIGKSLYPEPLFVSVRTDILEKKLPRCTALVVSCNTRPYHSYGPVARRIFEESQPHRYPEMRKGLEGVMEIGNVRTIPPGGLLEQAEKILLACISPLTGSTNLEIIDNVLRHLAEIYGKFPFGSTLRMPIIGTGKAFQGHRPDEVFREVVDMTLSHFYNTVLPTEDRFPPRRLLLVHPLEYESNMITTVLAEKSIFLTILDKMGLTTSDKRLVYGLAYSEDEKSQMNDFTEAISHFDNALDKLLRGERKPALKEAAKGAEVEPELRGMYGYITNLAQRHGLLDGITKEALVLAEDGRIRDAFCVANSLLQLGGKSKDRKLLDSLRNCYMDCCISALEALLLYENYMQAEDGLDAIHRGIDIIQLRRERESDNNRLPAELIQNLSSLEYLSQKIPQRIIENTFHIVIRKFMADYMELQGAKRALENLSELHKHDKVKMSEEEQNTSKQLAQLIDTIEPQMGSSPQSTLKKDALEKLLKIIPDHPTLCLEAARYYLKGGEGQKTHANLSRSEIEKAWESLTHGFEKNEQDYGILAYMGFIALFQGHKFMTLAEEFFTVFAKLIEDELTNGKFAIRKIKSPDENIITISTTDSYTSMTQEYYRQYRECLEFFASMAKSIYQSESTAAIALYQKATASLRKIGRSDLAALYDNILGETWVALLCRNQQHLGSIPLPFGEISLDLLFNFYRKFRYWWKYRKLSNPQIRKAISAIVKKMGKRLTR